MNALNDLLLPGALAFIMLSLGLTLELADFRRVFTRPRAIAAGLLGQVVLLPVIAFATALAFRLPPELAAGLMILAACPGGVSAGLVTQLARGETALSISLTAITSVAAVVTAPVIVGFALGHFTGGGQAAELSLGKLVRGIFLLTTIPVVLGMALRHVRRTLVLRLAPWAERLATLFFVLIVIAFFIGQRSALADNLPSLGPAILALNLATLASGFALGPAFRLGRRERIAIASECGLQNAALGIFIAATALQAPALALPSVVYALLMNVSAILFVVWMRRSGKEE